MPVQQIMRGAYLNWDLSRLAAFEKQLGLSRPLDYVRVANGTRDWQDWETSAASQAKLFRPAGRMVQFCMAPFPKGVSSAAGWKAIADCKDGDTTHARLVSLFRRLAAECPGAWDIPWSPGYEGNGDWFPWYITKAIAPDAKRAMKRLAEISRSVSRRYRLIINFAEWNNGGGISFEDVFPGREWCDDLGMNIYVKQEYQGSNPDGILRALMGSKAGWDSMVREAKKLGVRGIWIPEWGLRPHAKGGNQTEAIDLTSVVSGFGDAMLREAQNFDRIGYLFWSGRTDAEAYNDPTGTGKFPKLDRAIKALDERVLAYNAKPGATPPIVTPAPLPPAEAQQPAPPADPAVALLTAIHEGAWAERRRNPATPLATLEHVAWAARVRLGLVAGDAPDGQAPLPALLAIYRADVSGYDASARAMATAWQDQAEPLLEAAGLLVESEEPDPVTPEPAAPAPAPDDTGAEMEALRRENETLRERVASTTAELVAARAALAMIRAALPPG